jgi:uncharacterized lipoprotein YajG
MRFLRALLACTVLAALYGCSTNNVRLSYSPSVSIVRSTAPAISVGSFTDQRGETPTWFGAIRGGYGNPLKKLEADPSVAELIKAAFADGLKARGIYSSESAAFEISGTIRKFDCSQYVRREAHAEIEVRVFSKSTGRQVFAQTYTADELEGSLLALNVGVFASVDALRLVAEKTLNEVVDRALDDSAFRNALRSL